MRKSPKTWLAATAVLLGTASATFGYDVKNPALPPVEFKDAHPQAPLKFVESGELKFAIIIDKNQERTRRYPNEKSILAAVDLLQEAFVNCTGRKPEVFDVTELDKAKKYPYQLLLGKSALTAALGMDGMKLPREGFEVKTFPDGVAIVGFDYYDKYLTGIRAATQASAKEAAVKLIPTENYVLVVVGKADEIRDQLKKFGTWTEKKISDPGF